MIKQALRYIINLRPSVPMSIEKPCTIATNSEIRRWLDGGMIEINGERPKALDMLDLPIQSCIFFPNSKQRRTTIV